MSSSGVLSCHSDCQRLIRQDGKRPDDLTLMPLHGGRVLVTDVTGWVAGGDGSSGYSTLTLKLLYYAAIVHDGHSGGVSSSSTLNFLVDRALRA